jgi:small subunit ribosomal protein S8e
VKGAIIQVDATPFRQWYEAHVRNYCHLSVQKQILKGLLLIQYAQPISKKAKVQATAAGAETKTEEQKKSQHVQRILEERKKGNFCLNSRLRFYCSRNPIESDAKIDPMLESQFAAGRLYAAISSRPGQSGRGDGYILEGKELEVRHEIQLNCAEIRLTWIA